MAFCLTLRRERIGHFVITSAEGKCEDPAATNKHKHRHFVRIRCVWGRKGIMCQPSWHKLSETNYRISQIIQLSAQFCLNIFIYLSSLHVSGTQVPIIRRKSLYLCDTGICHFVWVASGLLFGLNIQTADRTPPIQSDEYQCRRDTAIFS